jgi:uroporphyrinogen-III synthase
MCEIRLHVNPFWSPFEKFQQPGHQGVLNPRRDTKRTVLLEKLVQQGHKVKSQNVYLPAQCKETNSLLCSGV